MVKSTFFATILPALLASTILASPTRKEHPPQKDECAVQKKILLPMTESTHGAAFNITVGNPPQTVTMLSDWTWQDTWVDSAHCNGTYSVEKCIPKGQNYFDDMKSSTFKNSTQFAQQSWMGTDYTPGMAMITSFGTDTVCFNSDANGQKLCANDIPISIANFTNPLPVVFDIGGVFGFAPVLPGYNATFYPAPYAFWKAGAMGPKMGWHMCGDLKSKDSCYGQDYLTIMGGTDTTVHDPEKMVYHNLVVSDCVNSGEHLSLSPSRTNYWSSSWTKFSIGSKSYSLKAEVSPNYNATSKSPKCDPIDPIAIWDQDKFGHGAPMPLAAFKDLVAKTGAKLMNQTNLPGTSPINTGSNTLYSVDCSKIKTFPDLNYEISHKQTLNVDYSQYIDVTYMPGTCLLNARVWDRPVDGAQTFFGLNVLSRSYLEFDYEKNVVGLAPLNKDLWK